MRRPAAVRGAFESHSRRNVVIVNIGYPNDVDHVNMSLYNGDVATTRRKRTDRRTYHHGDLGPALVREAARTIRTDGVEAVTLRDVGRRLGVSRTALYRHFADKAALLAAVAREGFQGFSRELREAWDAAGGGLQGLRAMGTA
jgi:hypothetical protein